MKDIIESNYNSIRMRGLITPDTDMIDFIDKLSEEFNEFKESCKSESFTRQKEELSDVILVCLNIAYHFNIDIEKELKKKIKKNYDRADGKK